MVRIIAVGYDCGARTWNMAPMSVTLDVSKLSGWLNADAPCRVERREHVMQGEAATGVMRAREERTLNIWDMSLTLDVLKLSDWLNTDARCRGIRAHGGGRASTCNGIRCWRHAGWEAGRA